MRSVAFIMSVYRGDCADWLREALDSMLTQVVKSIDVRVYLCADGPLTEELNACLSEYESRVHRLIRFPENRGLACALNAMIDALDDEAYVLRMDADDLCFPDRVARQVAFMDANPETLLCGSSIQEFRETPEQKGLLRTYPSNRDAMASYILKANPIAHPTVCFRREFFERVGVYNEAFPLRQDIELWFRAIAEKVDITNLRDPVLYFRVSEQLVQRRNLSVGLVEFRIFMKGIYRMKGIHPSMLWPVMRLGIRLLPPFITRWVYGRSVRKVLNAS